MTADASSREKRCAEIVCNGSDCGPPTAVLKNFASHFLRDHIQQFALLTSRPSGLPRGCKGNGPRTQVAVLRLWTVWISRKRSVLGVYSIVPRGAPDSGGAQGVERELIGCDSKLQLDFRESCSCSLSRYLAAFASPAAGNVRG